MTVKPYSILIPFRTDNGYRQKILDWNLERLEQVAPDATEIIVADDGEEGPFNRSKAINNAFKQSTAPYIVVLDSDTCFDKGVMDAALLTIQHRIASSPFAFWPYDRYLNLNQESGERLLDMSPKTSLVFEKFEYDWVFTDPPQDPDRAPPVSGMLMVSRDGFQAIGGFDERFKGWGFEDWAFKIAAENVLGATWRIFGTVYHIWHPVQPGTTSDGPHYRANQSLYQQYQHNFNNVRQSWV